MTIFTPPSVERIQTSARLVKTLEAAGKTVEQYFAPQLTFLELLPDLEMVQEEPTYAPVTDAQVLVVVALEEAERDVQTYLTRLANNLTEYRVAFPALEAVLFV